jgi:hypothetical protein
VSCGIAVTIDGTPAGGGHAGIIFEDAHYDVLPGTYVVGLLHPNATSKDPVTFVWLALAGHTYEVRAFIGVPTSAGTGWSANWYPKIVDTTATSE